MLPQLGSARSRPAEPVPWELKSNLPSMCGGPNTLRKAWSKGELTDRDVSLEGARGVQKRKSAEQVCLYFLTTAPTSLPALVARELALLPPPPPSQPDLSLPAIDFSGINQD